MVAKANQGVLHPGMTRRSGVGHLVGAGLGPAHKLINLLEGGQIVQSQDGFHPTIMGATGTVSDSSCVGQGYGVVEKLNL